MSGIIDTEELRRDQDPPEVGVDVRARRRLLRRGAGDRDDERDPLVSEIKRRRAGLRLV